MKNIILSLLLLSYIYADKAEKHYWDEVKNSSDIELLKSYKKQYPHGTFDKIADIKIKRLQKERQLDINDNSYNWVKGKVEYQFYGIGKANKHFKGKNYQKNLARSRAKKKLMKLYHKRNLSDNIIMKYNSLLENKQYVDERGRLYMLLYIDNYNLID